MARALSAFSKRPFKMGKGLKTLAQFLDATRQGPLARERFWIPLCDSVMNVPPELAPLGGMGEVLHRIFFGNARDSALAVPASALKRSGFPVPLLYLEQKGGSVFFHEGIQSFRMEENNFQLASRSGKIFTGDALIWAVPPPSLFALWPAGTWPRMASLPQLGKSPILSVHLILSQKVTREHLVGLSGSPFEWVFNRNANWGWRLGRTIFKLRGQCAAGKYSLLPTEKGTGGKGLGRVKGTLPRSPRNPSALFQGHPGNGRHFFLDAGN